MDNTKSSDEEIAEKLRLENPAQFNTLVRMHLSFQLDLHTDENDSECLEKTKEKKWKHLRRQTKLHCKSKDYEDNSTLRSVRSIKRLITFLEKEQNLTQEGIFRKTGSLTRQNELKNILHQNEETINLEEKGFTAHDCASVLKSVLADLPEPLLTEVYYPAYCQVAEIYNTKDNNTSDRTERIMHTLQLLFLLLPQDNNIILHDVIKLLNTTVIYKETNKMSAENLATLFTPHLICPRKLSPESLHTTAAFLSGIISFMITNGSNLFHTPPKLATDIRVYFMEKHRRPTMTPDQKLNESSTSDSTAKTVFSFVDREKTAEAHQVSSTETALAQLYAHIQTLPESSKKKRLIKKFNYENGNGTPMLNKEKNASIQKCGKSFSASIKKHIFTKNVSKTPKRDQTNVSPFNTPSASVLQPKSRILFPKNNSVNSPNCNNPEGESITNVVLPTQIKTLRLNLANSNDCDMSNENINAENDMNILNESRNIFKKKNINSYDDMNDEDIKNIDNNSYFSLDNKMRFKSEPNLSKTLNIDDELMIDSPPSSLRETNNNKIKTFFTNKIIKGMSMGNLKLPFMHETSSDNLHKNPEITSSTSLSSASNSEYIMLNDNKIDNFKINITDPKMEWGFNDLGLSTPVDRKSMSPITKSTQRMPKAMQESIMTPRSRKPVMLLGSISSSSNVRYSKKHYTRLLEEEDEEGEAEHAPKEHGEMNFCQSKEIFVQMNDTGLPVESLTNTFRDYLYSRSLQTASPTDLSFSSQPDDFVSTTDINDMSENDMTDSMLFCMNGNKPFATEIENTSRVVDEPRSRMGNAVRKRRAEDEGDKNEVLLLDETSL